MLLLMLAGCISELEEPTINADILFVIDNSGSMKEESSSLGQNISTLTDVFNEPASLINYNIGITTTSVDYSAGLTSEIDSGEMGSLTQCDECENGVITKSDPNVEQKFKEAS